MLAKLEEIQLQVCQRYGVVPLSAPAHLKVGINRNTTTGIEPLNALRVPPSGDTSGWFIWAGEEWSDDVDFFDPLCIEHLKERCSQILPFLQLPPGWRVLLATGQVDVWHDPGLT